MPPRTASMSLPLPRGWTKVVRSATLHAISVATTALTAAWGRAATGRSSRQRRRAELDRLWTEIALLTEELQIKDARWARLHPRRRPYYGPVHRLRILQLRAARGWTVAQVAHRFLVTEDTIASWVRRVDEEGEHALVRTEEPVNKFPDFVGHLVRRLKATCPSLGKTRIAKVLARAGLHLGATTVGRMLKRVPSRDDLEAEEIIETGRRVTAKRPHHIWHVDLTTIPTSSGFWVPWFPFAKLQRWPFCWWAAFVIDHASRMVVGFALFDRRPTSAQVCAFLGRAIRRNGTKPRYVIADKGKEFFCGPFKGWCRRHHIRPRFGAIGKHGSIALIERFIRSMKNECTRRILVPLRRDALRRELTCYATWFNKHRPHTGLDGRTPFEVVEGLPPANEVPRFEPHPRWPRGSPCAEPAAVIRGRPGVRLRLVVRPFEDRPHLPVVALATAA